ncbi:hypothetical protein [Crocinitomix algicola]|uniref:hypothetical protein n=1 Tax=Crocinitomix algicola TaxID=1740263 RepID=UPI0008294F16|nr:hypothetical protein [Crocinitomix algicola]
MRDKLQKLDKVQWGIIIGLILPVFGFLLAYPVFTREQSMPFEIFIKHAKNGPYSQNIMIFSLIPNMFFFYLSNFRWNMLQLTKGLVGITLVLGIILVAITVL